MKANEFVKNEGMEEARFLLDEWDGVTTNWSMEDGFVYVGSSVDTHMLCLETLKRLVESHELVESCGGLQSVGEKLTHGMYESRAVIERLKQAIADVESCK